MESSRDSFAHPDLGLALRTLRRQVRLTQKQVAEAVSARGVRLSTIWYARLEREPDARPSRQTLGAILDVLGSTWHELDVLLGSGTQDGDLPLQGEDQEEETWSAPIAAAGAPPPPSPLVELVSIWERLSSADRAVLLAFARSLTL